MENVSLMMAGAQLGHHDLLARASATSASPRSRTSLEGPFEAIGVPEALVHPVSFAIALG